MNSQKSQLSQKSQQSQFLLFTDGGARGNPGPGAAGIVLKKGGEVVFAKGRYLGDTLTNNQAEYRAILGGLQVASKMGVKEIRCHLDSELVVKQLRNEYKVKDQELKVLFAKVKKAEEDFKKISFHYIPREKNVIADKMVNEALDREMR